uniref:Uncharacterized protein n=1 Tax=Caenorhabditis japonica TaxID=281687 RepID=A0A8R1I9T4_CAEJA
MKRVTRSRRVRNNIWRFGSDSECSSSEKSVYAPASNPTEIDADFRSNEDAKSTRSNEDAYSSSNESLTLFDDVMTSHDEDELDNSSIEFSTSDEVDDQDMDSEEENLAGDRDYRLILPVLKHFKLHHQNKKSRPLFLEELCSV